MIDDRDTIIPKLKAELADNPYWHQVLDDIDALVQVHLAIFNEPYLSFIATGRKTIESRFSKKRIPPFESVEKGDILLLKRSGGDITGICIVEKVWFYNIAPGTLDIIREKFGMGISAVDDDFWNSRLEASFCSLIWVAHYTAVNDIPFSKSDRRGWVILK